MGSDVRQPCRRPAKEAERVASAVGVGARRGGLLRVTTRNRPPNALGSSRVISSAVERTSGPSRRFRSEKSGLITRLARRRSNGACSSSPKLVEDRHRPPGQHGGWEPSFRFWHHRKTRWKTMASKASSGT